MRRLLLVVVLVRVVLRGGIVRLGLKSKNFVRRRSRSSAFERTLLLLIFLLLRIRVERVLRLLFLGIAWDRLQYSLESRDIVFVRSGNDGLVDGHLGEAKLRVSGVHEHEHDLDVSWVKLHLVSVSIILKG